MKENYINYITYTRQYADATITNYKKSLRYFERYLDSIGKDINKPECIKLVDMYNFMGWLSKNGLCAKTCAGIIDWVKIYLKYCKDVLELNIIDLHKVKSPKVPDREIWFFSKSDKEAILKLVNEWWGDREETRLRNKVIVYLFLHTGLRVHELAKIKVNEIWESLQVIGKWKKRRFVYLRPEMLDLIYLYLGKRKKKSDFLFGGYKGWHINTDTINHIFQKMSKVAGIHIHAHKFRHTFATDLLHVPWANIYAVSKLMGHSRITTTQIYLGTDNFELKKIQFWLVF